MKKLITCIGLCVFTSLFNESKAQTIEVKPVYDKYKNNQLMSQVFIQWDKDKFIPKWYYWLFHNKYRNGPDRRTLLQLVPAAAAVGITRDESLKEKEDTETVAEQELYDALNRESETHYHLYFKKKFDQLNEDIDNLLVKCLEENADTEIIQSLGFEQIRLNDQLNIIREGYLEKGDSAAAMEEVEFELKMLKAKAERLLYFYKIKNKYPEPEN